MKREKAKKIIKYSQCSLSKICTIKDAVNKEKTVNDANQS